MSETELMPPEAQEPSTLPAAQTPERSLPSVQEEPAKDTAITPAQARIEAVATALASAYSKASLLQVTPDEAKALAEPFPDEAFSLGAGGDPNLVYIEHAYLRQRLNSVLGVGAAVPIRRREWAEDGWYYKEGKRLPLIRVYVDLVLVVRGAVVGEAIGDSVYYPNNAKTNYSDALESAKSNAFRRCCKEFGVGLQAWMKGWCEEWKKRHYDRLRQPPTPPPRPPVASPPPKPPQDTAQPPKPAQKPAKAQEKPLATEDQRQRFITLLKGHETAAKAYFEDQAWLLPTETLEMLPLIHCPVTKSHADKIVAAVLNWERTHATALAPTGQELPTDPDWWRGIIVPIPRAGQKRGEYLKAPDLLGTLYDQRHDEDGTARDRLFGFIEHFEPSRTWKGLDGKEHERSQTEFEVQTKFRQALDACKAFMDADKERDVVS